MSSEDDDETRRRLDVESSGIGRPRGKGAGGGGRSRCEEKREGRRRREIRGESKSEEMVTETKGKGREEKMERAQTNEDGQGKVIIPSSMEEGAESTCGSCTFDLHAHVHDRSVYAYRVHKVGTFLCLTFLWKARQGKAIYDIRACTVHTRTRLTDTCRGGPIDKDTAPCTSLTSLPPSQHGGYQEGMMHCRVLWDDGTTG